MLFLRNVLRSFALTNPLRFIILPALICFFALILYRLDGPLFRKSTVIPAAFGSLFTIIGYSFATQENWDLVVTSFPGQWLKVIFAFVGYGTLYMFLAAFCFEVTDYAVGKIRAGEPFLPGDGRAHPVLEKWNSAFRAHPFRYTFLILLIGCVPAAIASYPAIFMGDTSVQIVQGFSEIPRVLPYYMNGRLISDAVHINAHHPVLHTVLIHLFILLGTKVFHSAGAGLFLLDILQVFLLILVLSYGVSVLVRHAGLTGGGIALMLAMWIFIPLSQNYFFLMTKDIFYTAALLWFLISLFLILRNRAQMRHRVGFLLASLGILLFRNDGRYILIAAMAVIFLMGLKRPGRPVLRRTALGGLIVTILGAVILNLILSACSVTPGSRREMLSLPFQQTARYLRYHGDDVAEEEWQAIDAVLDADTIGEVYDPDVSDPVKGTYNEDAATEDLMAYFRVWGRMLLRHPGCYMQATIGNYYGYVSPAAPNMQTYNYGWSEQCMDTANRLLEPLGISFSYPDSLDGYREVYQIVRNSGDRLPLISMFMKPALYVWTVAFLVICGLRYRSRNVLAIAAVPVFMILICFLGPCNGVYARYLYPIMMALPLQVRMTLSFLAERKEPNG